MAHNFSESGNNLQGPWRRCINCEAAQVYTLVQYNRMYDSVYRWRPLIGRCTVNNMGRPPLRRDAVLAAIRDGRHTPTGIAAHAGLSIPVTRTALSEAKRQGFVVNFKERRGWWELAPEEEK